MNTRDLKPALITFYYGISAINSALPLVYQANFSMNRSYLDVRTTFG